MQVLVISTHPDDETLGCGGTLLKHRAAGDRLSWVVVTQVHEPRWSAEEMGQKSEEVRLVAEAYGVENCFKLGLPTVLLDTVPQVDIIAHLRDAIAEVKPEIIYLVHDGDVHSDHHAVFSATMSVLKPFHMANLGGRRVLSYETLSSTEAAPPQLARVFLPNVFSDITQYIDQKIDVMALYQSEIQRDPLPRGPSAIRALARFRGATIGVEYAEAFILIRELM